MNNEPRYLTATEAESLLNTGDNIHTLVNPGNNMLMGCDMSRKAILELFNKSDGKIEIGGPSARSMKHAIVVHRESGPLFIENNPEALDKFDPQ